eukprot:gene15155-biopygen5825
MSELFPLADRVEDVLMDNLLDMREEAGCGPLQFLNEVRRRGRLDAMLAERSRTQNQAERERSILNAEQRFLNAEHK